MAFKTGFLTIITLGFYRFWMKTRLRRWYWSAIRPGGHPMEYVGDPIEKLLGFFIAVVILTFYIGIINLILMFVSFSVFSSATLGYFAAGLGLFLCGSMPDIVRDGTSWDGRDGAGCGLALIKVHGGMSGALCCIGWSPFSR
ncbi:DUF898 family protein [Sulfitobacter pontiacus]